MNRQRNTFVTIIQIHRDLIAVAIIILLLVSVTFAGQWPHLCGPNGQGINDATPAVADERMYLRTTSHVVCLGGTAK